MDQKIALTMLRRRSQRGATIVEGVVMTTVMVIVAISLLLFILNLGMTLLYTEKVSCVASTTANALSLKANGWEYQDPNGAGRNFDAEAFAKNLGAQLGLPANKVTAQVTRPAADIAVVTVTATDLPLILGCDALPGKITVKDTFAASTALLPRPTGLLTITAATGPGTGPSVALPCYSGLAQGGNVGSRGVAPQAPLIPGPGMYDQFSFAVPSSAGAAMTFTAGDRGVRP